MLILIISKGYYHIKIESFIWGYSFSLCMTTERSNKLEEIIEIAQTRWENCMGEADDNIAEAHRLYVKKGSTKLGGGNDF